VPGETIFTFIFWCVDDPDIPSIDCATPENVENVSLGIRNVIHGTLVLVLQ
jgi:hypothetical protein